MFFTYDSSVMTDNQYITRFNLRQAKKIRQTENTIVLCYAYALQNAHKIKHDFYFTVVPHRTVQHIPLHSNMQNLTSESSKNTQNASIESYYHAQHNDIVVEMIHCKSTDEFYMEKYHIFPNRMYNIHPDILLYTR